jgi:hypothetical protein
MRYMVITDPTRPEALPAMLPQTAPSGDGAALFWGAAGVYGQPGTVPVSSPRPAALTDTSWGPYVQPSGCAPDYIMPSQYHNVPSNRWSHVRTQSNNVMPVPAANLHNMPGIAYTPQMVGGQYQVAQPQAISVWPDLNTGPLPNGLGNAGWRGAGNG